MFAGFEGIAFSQSLFILKISIFIFGLGGGIINGSTNAVVAHITENNKGANLSLLGVFFGIGALGMPLILAMLAKIFSLIASGGYSRNSYIDRWIVLCNNSISPGKAT
jgi:MFS family permease